jgi:hypothetical protein
LTGAVLVVWLVLPDAGLLASGRTRTLLGIQQGIRAEEHTETVTPHGPERE